MRKQCFAVVEFTTVSEFMTELELVISFTVVYRHLGYLVSIMVQVETAVRTSLLKIYC
jgi:hypothetical protein